MAGVMGGGSGSPADPPAADEVLGALGCAFALLDPTGLIVGTNPAWDEHSATWGAAGQHFLEAGRRHEHHDIDLVLDEGIRRVLSGHSDRFELEYPVERSGGRRWHMLVTTSLSNRSGWAVVVHVDVTVHHDVADLLAASAHRDVLTGLPNRLAMTDRLNNAVTRGRHEGAQVSVVFLDLDGFKGVNDQFGHEVGDEVLTAVGRRLAGTIRSDDVLGRWGGDEFVVVVDGGDDAVTSMVTRLHAAMAQPLAVSRSRSIQIRISVGATQVRARDSRDDVLARADAAMFEAKRSGRPLVRDDTPGAGAAGRDR